MNKNLLQPEPISINMVNALFSFAKGKSGVYVFRTKDTLTIQVMKTRTRILGTIKSVVGIPADRTVIGSYVFLYYNIEKEIVI